MPIAGARRFHGTILSSSPALTPFLDLVIRIEIIYYTKVSGSGLHDYLSETKKKKVWTKAYEGRKRRTRKMKGVMCGR